ncbi:MAG: DNA alkylation repair protein [Gammaproteobacteria bacterium]|nr:DNA alkylation repair protein [Gammaproteobacteria bacterium]
MPGNTTEIRAEFRELGSADIAIHSQRFFKTGAGEYGEGDRFLGIRVPVVRQFVRTHRGIPLRTVVSFLRSGFHEERMFGLLALVDRYRRGDDGMKQRVYELYMDNLDYVNNWDLVDSTAHLIVGPQLQDRSRRALYRLARSRDIWKRRVAIMATFHYIRGEDYADTLALAELLLDDPHDLMHKAVGWMLREVGNRDLATEERFLRQHYKKMPRTMLRYAIEKFPEQRRQAYLQGRM